MKRGTPDHPKTHALAAELNVERYAAVGLLEMLWHFTAHYAKRGDVGRHSDLAIARAIGWDRDPVELIRGLVASGWLDPCSCHRLVIHDWARHADQGVGRSEEVKAQGFIDQAGCASRKLESSSATLDKDSLPLPCLAVALPEPEPLPAAREAALEQLRKAGDTLEAIKTDAEPWPTIDAWVGEVLPVYRERLSRPEASFSPLEFALARKWWERRVPPRVVAMGIRLCRGTPSRPDRALLYLGKSVEEEIEKVRTNTGFGAAAPVPP